MLKNSNLSELSLLSSKKPAPSASKRNRTEFETDYTQDFANQTKKPINEPLRASKILNAPIMGNSLSLEANDKTIDPKIHISSIKNSGIEEVKTRWLKKSDQIYCCKRISDKLDNYLEHDEIFADVKNLKDEINGPKSMNDGKVNIYKSLILYRV